MKNLIIIATMLFSFAFANAQTIQTSSRSTAGYIKSDGTIQNSSRSTVGYIKDDGTVQNSSRTTIGYASGVPKEWAAVTFFFFSL